MNKLLLALLLLATPAKADVQSITFARQFGIAFLPFLIMEDDHLIEKHAEALGLQGFKVNWTVLSGGAAANDGLLSGQLAFGIGAVPAMLLLWDKTRTTPNAVRAIMGAAIMPTTLNTRNPNIHSVRDFTDKDKIALPAIKVSNAALTLQMAAAKEFGPENFAQLDRLTVALPHPDAAAQIMSSAGTIDTHFASPPFTLFELRAPGVHTVLTSVDLMGDASLTLIWTTQRFHDANPKVVQAVFDAVQEALNTVNADKPAAAERYLKLSGDKLSREDLLATLADPHIQFSAIPRGTMDVARFMKQTGALKTTPTTWTDLFFPLAQSLPGS